MSTERSIRRAARRARTEALLRASESAPALLVASDENRDLFRAGRVAFVVPRLREDLPVPVKDALALRRLATLTGTCACGARRRLRGRSVVRITFDHAPGCQVSDEAIQRLLEAS